MNSQAYKDDVQPAEKTPADVEHTKGAFQYPPPPQQKKPIAHQVLFTLAFVCFGVCLISFLILHDVEGEMAGGLVLLTIMFAFVSGVILLALGVAFYPTDRKSR
jgi:hypothetical protein